MGNSPGESVTLKVILAFLLPLIVFIVSLAVFGRVLARVINTEGLQIALSFLLALLATFLCVFITRVLNKRPGSDN
jgi:positive regulator of sigma E activity